MASGTLLPRLLNPDNIIGWITFSHRFVHEMISGLGRKSAFSSFRNKTENGELKWCLRIDGYAQNAIESVLKGEFDDEDVRILGEETLDSKISLEGETRPCVLVDMIDGTDLFVRDFSNWCSALTVFTMKPKPKILASYVAIPSPSTLLYLDSKVKNTPKLGDFYYAIDGEYNAFRKELKLTSDSVPGLNPYSEGLWDWDWEYSKSKRLRPAKSLEARDASVCMYAQKCSSLRRLLELPTNSKLLEWLTDLDDINVKRRAREEEDVQFRFYNLAGNPMIARLCEGQIGAVVSLSGQKPHDFVPAAFIAYLSDAFVGRLDRHSIISPDELAQLLVTPGIPGPPYIIAANESLYRQIRGYFE